MITQFVKTGFKELKYGLSAGC